jgi:S1-C subfamily serine protease
VPIQPGNSGGPLFDDRGNVVGVITSRLDPSVALEMTGMPSENVNYAVKSEKLLGWIRSLKLPSMMLPAAKVDRQERFEDVIEGAEKASAMIVVF